MEGALGVPGADLGSVGGVFVPPHHLVLPVRLRRWPASLKVLDVDFNSVPGVGLVEAHLALVQEVGAEAVHAQWYQQPLGKAVIAAPRGHPLWRRPHLTAQSLAAEAVVEKDLLVEGVR